VNQISFLSHLKARKRDETGVALQAQREAATHAKVFREGGIDKRKKKFSGIEWPRQWSVCAAKIMELEKKHCSQARSGTVKKKLQSSGGFRSVRLEFPKGEQSNKQSLLCRSRRKIRTGRATGNVGPKTLPGKENHKIADRRLKGRTSDDP